MNGSRIIDSESAMIAFGAEIAESLKAGDVVALVGQLGAGKTHFTKGIVSGLGGDPEAVTSPTFTLVHEYASGCRVPVFHFDFYRMDSAAEVLGIGWEDYLDEAEGILLVEWADKFPELLPAGTKWFRFEILNDGSRKLHAHGE
ncbi:MAG: tRNA (adenosine(37)-N6)-threonylcarbamoyltransferase complex ATPase subunit type 1 TsaE [Verrucomicrobiae bacterium]|nr:tRNA (adenosine(37)-N6)-threonylcarbamoyltransferase complex ATPase subunit type 1 TsaE [Verrucomicrobiae bacterium]